MKERKKLVREGFLSFRMKNFFLRWKNRCKNEQEALKNGGELNYWHGEDAWDVFQLKEREKLGGEDFLSFRTKKKFWEEKNGWKSEKEALKNGGELNYWLGEEAWKVFQSKEHEKLGREGFLSFGMKKMDILMKMHFQPKWVKPIIFANWIFLAKWNSFG